MTDTCFEVLQALSLASRIFCSTATDWSVAVPS